jgi:cytochrome c biogenesis factor
MVWLGAFSLLVVLLHASWKWGGAGGTSSPGAFGPVGPAFLVALLLWPMFITSCICVIAILTRPRTPEKPKAVALLFVPIILYGIYFLIFGGSGERAGIR